MTQISIALAVDAPGGRQGVPGLLTATAQRLRTDDATVIIPGPVDFPIAATGTTVVNLDSPGPDWSWHLKLSRKGGTVPDGFVRIVAPYPNMDTDFGSVDFEDGVAVVAAGHPLIAVFKANGYAVDDGTSQTLVTERDVVFGLADVTWAGLVDVDPATRLPIASPAAGLESVIRDAVVKLSASSEVAADAAAAAVGANIAGRDLVLGTDARMVQQVYDESIGYAVVDADDRMSWLATTPTGGIPDHSAEAILARTAAPIAAAASAAVGITSDPDVALQGASFVIVDQDGNQSDFALAPDGTIHQRTVDAIARRLPKQDTGFMALTTAGDSVTESLDRYNGGVKWAQIVADNLGIPLTNLARSGEATADIAFRAGALGLALVIPGNSLPATTDSITVTFSSPTNGFRNVENGVDGIGQFEVVGGGVTCMLRNENGTWKLARKVAASSATTILPGTKFYTQLGKAHRQDIWIIWSGHNGGDVVRDINTIVSFLGSPKRFIVPQLLANSTQDTLLASTYPEQYAPVRTWLIANGLAAAGLTATTDDLADIAAGNVPRSLRFDSIHPNAAGNLAIAAYFTQLLISKGWATR